MRISAFICLLLIPVSIWAQQPSSSRADLEKRRQSILESIKETQEQLEATKKDKKATLSQLRALQAKLDARQRLIGNINEEISQIDNNINTSAKEVNHLQSNLEVLKMRYAQSLRYAYRNRNSYNMLAFLFSSTDFNDAVLRMKYLKKYRDYRKEQADEIRLTQGQIKQKINVLNTQKNQKSVLLTAEEQQKQTLLQETNQTNEVAKELKGREKELAIEIQKNQKTMREVDKAINKVIQREIELARKKAEEEARKRAEEARLEEQRKAALAAKNNTGGGVKLNTGSGMRGESGTTPAASNTNNPAHPPSNNPVASNTPKPKPAPASYSLSMTPEVAELSNNFKNNKGRLPWPVEKGVIVGTFGKHPSPIAEKVIIENNGIDIQTAPNANVRAVFDGRVTGIFYVPGAGQNVIVNHGEYYTVYARLSSVAVKKDQEIKTKQSIGTVESNDDGVPILNFQIFKGAVKMDPQGWIAR